MIVPLVAVAFLSKPVAVLIHGAGGGGWEYDKWRPALERAGWQVVARDLMPAHGGLAATRLEDYVHQVESWCPKDRPFVLVGASMGGAIALEAAREVPARAVVLVNSVPPGGLDKKKYLPSVVKWAGGPLKDTRDSMPDSDEPTILWAWKRWRDESGQVMLDLQQGTRSPKPLVPTLVVVSREDTDVPPERGRNLAREWNADLIELSRTSHVGPLLGRRAGEVARMVSDWAMPYVSRNGTTGQKKV